MKNIKKMPSQVFRANAPELDPLRIGTGWKPEDLGKIQVFIESTFGDSHPGSGHLNKLVEAAREGVREEGGYGARYFTTDMCDGESQGNDGINYSLCSREMIANMIEIQANATPFDAGVYIASCDKGMPGNLIGLARVDIPSVVMTGGTMAAGPDMLTLEQLGMYSAQYERGEIDEAKLTWAKHNACPSCGACSFIGTASTMQIMAEALGLALPGSALLQEFMSVWYRGPNESEERAFFETIQHPNFNDIEEIREAIEEYYQDDNKQASIQPSVGYKEIYLSFMDKISQNCSFCILDDYSYFIHNGYKHGKLFLIDPYDVDTLQIFFDIELDKYPEKIDVIDVVTKKHLSKDYYMNKNVVNVEPYKAIIDINYYFKKIEECINNRKSELLKMQAKDIPLIPNDTNLNIEKEMQQLPGDVYLEMSILPLLHNAINMCDMIRPPDPINFIANFMLMNKDKAKNIEDIIKELPEKKGKKDEKICLMIDDEITNEKFEEEIIAEKKEEERKKLEEEMKAKEEEEIKKKEEEANKKAAETTKKGKTKSSVKGKK